MLELLSDPAVTGAVVVTTPEEMPVVETIELAARLQADTTVSLSAVVVNRALPELFTRAEAGVYEALAARPELLRDLIGVGMGPVFAAAHIATQRRRLQAEQLEVLRQALGVDTPLLFVPELFARLRGMRATTTIADRLAEEL
jgi:anion-transporting  ArsA/GET3 family ATPase